jgi:hypothetical protein
MHRFTSCFLLSAILAFTGSCATESSSSRPSAVLFDGNADQVPDKADTNGDGKPDVALGNSCQLVCDGTKLTGIDINCDGDVDFDITPVDLPVVCGGGGGSGGGSGGGGSGGGSGGGTTAEACASAINDKSVSCSRDNGGPWSCECKDGTSSRTVSYQNDDACSIPGGACF